MSRIPAPAAAAALVALSSVISAGALAQEGTWLVRGGLSIVDPKSDNLTLGPGTTLQVDDAIRPTFDVTYMFRDRWGVELLASTFFKHDLEVRPPTGTTRLGELKHLPPTLSLQYHFNPDGRFRPYAGLGVNYTFLFDESPEALSVGNSFGPAAQLGLDVGINERWFLNLSARYIDIDGDVRLGGTNLGTVEVDPVVFGLHVGFKLGN
jgi:outer membrane protein